MKKINLNKTKVELVNQGADKNIVDLILNNIRLYNDLVDRYNQGEIKVTYILYQLNLQLTKQFDLVNKSSKKSPDGEEDGFLQMQKSLKNNSYEQR